MLFIQVSSEELKDYSVQLLPTVVFTLRDTCGWGRGLRQHWAPAGVHLPSAEPSPEVIAAIIRLTRESFRLLARLITQMRRVLMISGIDQFSLAVVETARENLVIGQA